MSDVEWEEEEEVVAVAAPAASAALLPSSTAKPESGSSSAPAVKEEQKPPSSSSVEKDPAVLLKSRQDNLAYYEKLDKAEANALAALSEEYSLEISISNMAAVFNLGGQVDLRRIARVSPNAELDLGKRPFICMRRREPPCSVQVQRGGHVSVIAGHTRSDLYRTARMVANCAKKSGACPNAVVRNFAVNNIVISCSGGDRWDLENLFRHMVVRSAVSALSNHVVAVRFAIYPP